MLKGLCGVQVAGVQAQAGEQWEGRSGQLVENLGCQSRALEFSCRQRVTTEGFTAEGGDG